MTVANSKLADAAEREPLEMAPSCTSQGAHSLGAGEGGSVTGDERAISLQGVFAFLAETPDLDALKNRYPTLSIDILQAYFAEAAGIAAGDVRRDGPDALEEEQQVVRRRKSATDTDIVRTHGLPEADGSLHKGNIFRALLRPLKPGRLLDLGAGKGNFALSAAEMGWQVTAVDARTVRWPSAEAADSTTADLIRSIRWVQADVREFPIDRGEYDLICMLGLLHHLELADQTALLKRCGGTLLLLDTRIAPAIVDRDGAFEGMIVREHGETREERDQVPTAAWGNALSFRHTEESLLRLVRDCGYAQVMLMRPPHRRDYTYYLCLPAVKSHESAGSRRRASGAEGDETTGTRKNRRSRRP